MSDEPGLPLWHSAEAFTPDLECLVHEDELAQSAVGALHDIARRLLGSTRVELIAASLRKIYEVVPAAQRISVVAWPPDPEHGFTPLLPEDTLRREGFAPGPISASLAGQAADARRALFFSDAIRDGGRASTSVLVHRIRSAVYVPLMPSDDEILGLLCVDTPQPTLPILPRDFHFIRAVGALLSAALGAERLREEARRRELEAHEEQVRRESMATCLRVASHDLKNPLVVVQLAAHALERAQDPAMRADMVRRIQDAARRSKRLIETYLAVTSLDAREPLSLRLSTVDPRTLVAEEIGFLEVATDEDASRVRFVNDVACAPLGADADRLRQVFANLLGNAAKYSPGGGVVRVWCDEGPAEVTFHVSDQGVGIDPGERDRLFQPFQRLGDTAAAAGTGLGLWITRALVEAHGGTIWVDSRPDRGSTFSFRLPRRVAGGRRSALDE